MSWHPKRRDVLLILTCLVVVGLFLQLDFSGSSHSRSSSIFKIGGLSRRPAFEKGGQRVNYAPTRNTVSQPKLKWGDRGAPHTKIVSHAPGTFSTPASPLALGVTAVIAPGSSAPHPCFIPYQG